MSANYWSKYIEPWALSRRRALALAGGALSATALLAACSGGDDVKATKDPSGLLYPPKDTTSHAVPGGTLITEGEEVTNVDPVTDQTKNSNSPPTFVYSRMLKFKTEPFPGVASLLNVEGDAMQSWEKSGDGLTWTFKLRPNLKWDSRAPTNGRNVTIEDVKYSWQRFEKSGFSAGDLMKSRTPDATIDSFTTPDANTLVLKLSYPFALLEHYMAFYREVTLIPVEAEDKVDLRSTMLGSGAWKLDKLTPSVGYEYVKNPDWYVKGRPFLDRVIRPIIPEYANRLSQLRAGNVDFLRDRFFSPAILGEDALPIKQARPDINMQVWKIGSGYGPPGIGFDLQPGSPFFDVRVRRAFSMLMDRDAYIDTLFNVPVLKAAGLPIEGLWNSFYGAGDPDYWTDPRSSSFGAGAEYYQFNPTEAKKLLQAANFPFNKDYPFLYSATTSQQIMEILASFFTQNGGVKIKLDAVPGAQSTQRVNQGGGVWDGGLVYRAGLSGGDIDQHLTLRLVPGSGPTGFYEKVSVPPEYSKFIDLLKTARKQVDPKKRIDILKNQAQQELSLQVPVVNGPGIALSLTFAQPWIGNWWAIQGAGNVDAQEVYTNYWYDASKKKPA